jgi:N-methylhydantoinase A/oxoprolinase/acetone carboxylase beta subunit
MPSDLRLSVVAGDERVDAVVVDAAGAIIARAGAPTGADVTGGATDVLLRAAAQVDVHRVDAVMLAAPRIIEALRDPELVDRVAVLRIGSPLTAAAPPLTGWPAALRRAISAGEAIAGGGVDYDGRTAAPLDAEAVRGFLGSVAHSARRVAITGAFSPVAPGQEHEAAAIVQEELGPDVTVSLSHEIGTLGLLERENATVLNGALTGAAERVGEALAASLAAAGIGAEAFLVRSDGTLMAADRAVSFPVLLLRSASALALDGACRLTGVDDAVVVDAGWTRAEVGPVRSGAPTQGEVATDVEGVPVDLLVPRVDRIEFGGPPPTHEALARILADAVGAAAGAPGPPAVVVVGARRDLVPDRLDGAGAVLRPRDGDVAAALAAADAGMRERAERICGNRPDLRASAIAEARTAALARAVHAGADPAALTVTDVDEALLGSLADAPVRIRVTVAGPRG